MIARPVTCPACGRRNDTHFGLEDDAPTGGDLGICWSCRVPFAFELVARALTPEERAEVDADYRHLLGLMLETDTPSEAQRLRKGGGL